MLRRREATTFTISFLDVMCCGFGVMVLLFLVIKHNPATMVTSPVKTADPAGEVSKLEQEILEGKDGLAQLRNTIADLDERIVTAQGLARKITEDLNDTSGKNEALASTAETAEIEKLKEQLQKLDLERQELESKINGTGQDTRSFVGTGNRQYLTGLKLGGNRILVLLDKSSSMLDSTIVNIIRRRNMSEQARRESPKWQRAVDMVQWLSTRFPLTSKYQIYPFNTSADSIVAKTRGQWLSVSDKKQLNQAITDLEKIIPEGGTSLENVFEEISHLSPLPDNIYLLTDGLPTQGRTTPRETTVTGRDRLELFEQAVTKLPKNLPVNIILLPMEGDPMAAGTYWQLAQLTNGSLMSPSEDWP